MIYRVTPCWTYLEKAVIAMAYAAHAVIRVTSLGFLGCSCETRAVGWATGRLLKRLKAQKYADKLNSNKKNKFTAAPAAKLRKPCGVDNECILTVNQTILVVACSQA